MFITESIARRFRARVDDSAGPDLCHVWTGKRGGSGMPCMHITRPNGQKTSVSPRRVAWQLAHGVAIPDGHNVMVTCQSKFCVNPKHLHLQSLDPINVFWRSVEKRENGCWIWVGETGKGGYGMFEKGRIRMRAHRFSYELHKGPIPTDDGEWCVCHTCDTPKCVNPEHLFLGRDADNMKDMLAKGRASWQKTRAATESPREETSK